MQIVNTVAPRLPVAERHDHLAAPEDLLTWSQLTGLADAAAARGVAAAWSASPAAGRRALSDVKEIREALYEVLSACLGNWNSSPATDDNLNHLTLAWASAVSRARLTPTTGGTEVARWVAGSQPALLITDRVAQDAVDLLCGIDVARLGSCPLEDGGCGWLFLDHSRNRSRRWCTIENCGTRAKARRLTERRRRSRTAPRD